MKTATYPQATATSPFPSMPSRLSGLLTTTCDPESVCQNVRHLLDAVICWLIWLMPACVNVQAYLILVCFLRVWSQALCLLLPPQVPHPSHGPRRRRSQAQARKLKQKLPRVTTSLHPGDPVDEAGQVRQMLQPNLLHRRPVPKALAQT